VLREVARRIPFARSIYRSLRRTSAARTRDDTYDQQMAEVISKVLNGSGSLVDVGANHGKVMRMAVHASPGGSHVAIEALPHLASQLERDFPGVTVHHCAAGRENGRTTFHHVVGREAYSGIKRRVYDFDDPEIRMIEVDVRRIDDLLPPAATCDILKLDVEGGELDALLGASDLMRRSRPLVLFEAGWKSSGAYGVGPDAFNDYFTARQYSITTAERWLAEQPPFTGEEFADAWQREYCFLAHHAAPAGEHAAPPQPLPPLPQR